MYSQLPVIHSFEDAIGDGLALREEMEEWHSIEGPLGNSKPRMLEEAEVTSPTESILLTPKAAEDVNRGVMSTMMGHLLFVD